MGFNLLVRPALEFHDEMECPSSTSAREHHQEGEKEGEGASNIVSGTDLKLKIPSCDAQVNESEGDGCKTPTSRDHKIPSSQPCPSAPKKPKSGKRKPCVVTGNFLDLSREIESLFQAPLLLDLCGKIKRVRRGN